jgi:hypothetical protein
MGLLIFLIVNPPTQTFGIQAFWRFFLQKIARAIFVVKIY